MPNLSIASTGITFPDATTQTTSALAANAIGATQLAANAVTAAKIADGVITAAKLGTTEQKQICKAWVNFNGTTLTPSTIRSSHNVSSITKSSSQHYVVNLTMSDANYSVVASVAKDNSGDDGNKTITVGYLGGLPSASGINITTSGGGLLESTMICVQVFGN